MLKNKSVVLFCFSPPVMLATFIIETLLAMYMFIRHNLNQFQRLIMVLLLGLAVFQLAEYQICTTGNNLLWSQIGYTAITLLPPLGIFLISLLSGKRTTTYISFAMAAVLLVAFMVPGVVQNSTCGGNYVILHLSEPFSSFYIFYYSALLLLGLWEASHAIPIDKKYQEVLRWIVVGYVAFMGPLAIAYAVSDAVRGAVPSIMCGFALIMAFILVFKVNPEFERLKQ